MKFNVFDVVNQNYRLTKRSGEVGIEVEVEATAPIMKNAPYPFLTKQDHSLRGNGYEFITAGVLTSKEKNSAIEDVCKFINENNPVINSPRTSVHVHHNMQNLTVVQAWTYMTAYYLLENLIFKFCDKDREGNTFCLRLTEADSALDGFTLDISQKFPFGSFRADRYKYMGGSPYPITRFGSFEWRGLEGGDYSPKKIIQWTDLIIALKENAIKFASPALLLDRYFYIGANIINELLPYDFVQFFRNQKNWQDLVKENACLIGNFAYAVDWIKYDEIVSETASKSKESKEKTYYPNHNLHFIMRDFEEAVNPQMNNIDIQDF